jgi:hypothetical protein
MEATNNLSVGLGRLYAPDARDNHFPMRTLLAKTVEPRTKYWRCASVLDQGATPHCVEFSWTQFVLSAPVMSKRSVLPERGEIYRQAQLIDEWPGENYDGTSVRAGAKVLHGLGRIAGYVWGFNALDVRNHLLTRGTVVVGTNWFDSMFTPDARGFIKPSGAIVGGHAYLIVGYSLKRNAFRILNSWGRNWGQNGRAWIGFNDLDYLIRDYGEACSAIEIGTVLE